MNSRQRRQVRRLNERVCSLGCAHGARHVLALWSRAPASPALRRHIAEQFGPDRFGAERAKIWGQPNPLASALLFADWLSDAPTWLDGVSG